MIDTITPVSHVVYNGQQLPMYVPPAPDVPEVMLQSKTVNPSTSAQDVTADGGYDGLSSVHVNAIQTDTKEITANGTYVPTGGRFFSSVTINIPFITYYTGSSAPVSSLGSNGDIYLQM